MDKKRIVHFLRHFFAVLGEDVKTGMDREIRIYDWASYWKMAFCWVRDPTNK